MFFQMLPRVRGRRSAAKDAASISTSAYACWLAAFSRELKCLPNLAALIFLKRKVPIEHAKQSRHQARNDLRFSGGGQRLDWDKALNTSK
jgi:hypothetical protein